MTLSHCIISGNTARVNHAYGGGGLSNRGTMTLTDCTVSGNSAEGQSTFGGGLSNFGMVTLTDCTISGNSAGGESTSGGGLFNEGAATLTNCTVSANFADNGGGVSTRTDAYHHGRTDSTNCTITFNSAYNGGGIYVDTASALNATNTIVAGNQASSGPDVYGSLTTNLNNLINMPAAAAGLGTLGNNGGPTKTIPLLPGSPAINAGTSVGAALTDQRGLPRFGPVDIGAFEVQAAPTISSTIINDGSAQRSRVTSLTVTFNYAVSFAGSVASAFTLTRTGGGSVNFSASASVVGGVTVVTLNNFTGAESQFGSLADGRYTLTALASHISANGQPLDGNGDGTPGDDYTFGDAQGLFRLFGDVNGDRHVDIADFSVFSNCFNSSTDQQNYLAYLDFDGDGHIDIADFTQFSLRFFTVQP
jgi:hypothetical protein